MAYRRTQSYSRDIRNQKGKIKIGKPNPKNHLYFAKNKNQNQMPKKLKETAQTARDF